MSEEDGPEVGAGAWSPGLGHSALPGSYDRLRACDTRGCGFLQPPPHGKAGAGRRGLGLRGGLGGPVVWCHPFYEFAVQSPSWGQTWGGLGALLGVASEAAFCPKPKLWARSQACEQVAQKKEFKTSSRYFQSPFLCPGDAAVAGGTPASSSPRPSPRPLGPLVGCIIVYFAVETCHV